MVGYQRSAGTSTAGRMETFRVAPESSPATI